MFAFLEEPSVENAARLARSFGGHTQRRPPQQHHRQQNGWTDERLSLVLAAYATGLTDSVLNTEILHSVQAAADTITGTHAGASGRRRNSTMSSTEMVEPVSASLSLGEEVGSATNTSDWSEVGSPFSVGRAMQQQQLYLSSTREDALYEDALQVDSVQDEEDGDGFITVSLEELQHQQRPEQQHHEAEASSTKPHAQGANPYHDWEAQLRGTADRVRTWCEWLYAILVNDTDTCASDIDALQAAAATLGEQAAPWASMLFDQPLRSALAMMQESMDPETQPKQHQQQEQEQEQPQQLLHGPVQQMLHSLLLDTLLTAVRRETILDVHVRPSPAAARAIQGIVSSEIHPVLQQLRAEIAGDVCHESHSLHGDALARKVETWTLAVEDCLLTASHRLATMHCLLSPTLPERSVIQQLAAVIMRFHAVAPAQAAAAAGNHRRRGSGAVNNQILMIAISPPSVFQAELENDDPSHHWQDADIRSRASSCCTPMLDWVQDTIVDPCATCWSSATVTSGRGDNKATGA